ncbi:hypothetical protein [Roseivivax jejudonensis]|uniref:hypothetical protein n=1 Tax=Roseivivax jejudonensis TaxID=1529041 RepID=UPI000A269F49|nr:hypothetical protein [Roseivivax jejudonensis]
MKEFARRHRQLRRKHRRLARGYVTRLGSNGVIEHQPRRELAGLVVPPIGVLLISFFGFKIVLFSSLGADAYGRHLSALAEGTMVERIGAVLMAADPLTMIATEVVSRLM